MKIIIDIAPLELIENKSNKMLEAYIKRTLKMFKINKIEIGK